MKPETYIKSVNEILSRVDKGMLREDRAIKKIMRINKTYIKELERDRPCGIWTGG